MKNKLLIFKKKYKYPGRIINRIYHKFTMLVRKTISLLTKRKPYYHVYMVDEIIRQQNTDKGYKRLDIIVRLLAVENEYGLNDYGWDMYRRMQCARAGEDEVSVDERVAVFRKLIASFKDNGYDRASAILLDKNMYLEDGSHRLSLALFHGIDSINCKVLPYSTDVYYGESWFKENGFSKQEISLILSKTEAILAQHEIKISCILWPPVVDFFDEITEDISRKYELVEVKDMEFSDETFERFMRAVYRVDDVARWKIDTKVEHIKPYHKKSVRLIIFKINAPRFRSKDINRNTILIQGEKLKKDIRDKYKTKVDNYYYDIICHTGDNVVQSEYIRKLCFHRFSLNDYFNIIDNSIKWEIIKLGSDNCPSDFPNSFPFSKDLDIVCGKKDFERFTDITVNYFKSKCSGYYDEIKVIHDDMDNCKVRIELNGYLILLIDISSALDGIYDMFIEDSLNRRIKQNNYYIPTLRDEMCFRINEYINHSHKLHHIDYVRNHSEYIDYDLVLKNVKDSGKILKWFNFSSDAGR
jgi:hypothetical protein